MSDACQGTAGEEAQDTMNTAASQRSPKHCKARHPS